MKYLVAALGLAVLLSIGIASAMVEMYRIEVASYDARVIAFYEEYFDFIAEQQAELAQSSLDVEQIQDSGHEVVM